MSGYVIVRELGRGASGVVSLVRRKADGRLFAAKEIIFSDVEERNQIMAEVRVMQSLPQHPSLLGLEEVLQSRSAVTMVIEYSAEGTLRDLVYGTGEGSSSSQGLPEEQVVRYLTQLVNALSFLHGNQVLHRDIKLENLLLFSQRAVVKISDFGVATILGRTSTGQERMAQTTAGTPHYMSPEVCEGNPYHFKSDVWSLGIVAYEMCATAVPFQAGNLLALSGKICHQATPDLPSEYSRRLNTIIKAMLTKNQQTRPSMREVAAMLQYYRRKRTDESPDGFDIGGFQVDGSIEPNALDDDIGEYDDRNDGGNMYRGAGGQEAASWGAPSVGVPDDGFWTDDGGVEDPTENFEDEDPVYTTTSTLPSTQVPPPPQERAVHQDRDRSASPESRMVNGNFSPEQRKAIFKEARAQAEFNKKRVEAEQRRINDSEEADGHAAGGNDAHRQQRSETPRLRGFVEELQEEMRKQADRVDSLYRRHSSTFGEELPHTSNKLRSPSPPPPPFMDPAAATPSAVRRSISPIRPAGIDESASPLYSPREAEDSSQSSPSNAKRKGSPRRATPPVETNAHTAVRTPPSVPQHATQHISKRTPQTTPRVTARSAQQPGHPSPPQNPQLVPPHSNTAGTASAGQHPHHHQQLPIAAGSCSPKPPKMVVRNGSLSSAPQAASQSQNSKENPYYPPCAQCIKFAKEKRNSLVMSQSNDGSSSDTPPAFVTIHPSKYYCSTCHAPLCEACQLIVHDPITTTTNLAPPALNGTLSGSAKRHNVFYLALSDPSIPAAVVDEPASPANSRKSQVTFSNEERAANGKVASRSHCGCCTIM